MKWKANAMEGKVVATFMALPGHVWRKPVKPRKTCQDSCSPVRDFKLGSAKHRLELEPRPILPDMKV